MAAARDRGSGAYVAVVGPEGIGKTRLVAELAAQAHQDGAIICFARCDPDHRSARAVFDQALRSAGSSLMRVQADARIGESLGATIARRLGEWAETAPVLLVLDDLHEAETEVLEVVADVAGSTRADRGPRRRAVPHGAGREQLAAPAPRSSWSWARLERDAVSAICELYGDAWTAADIDEIHAETLGVPLHVHEVATSRAREAGTRRVGEAAGHAQQAEARLSTSQQAVADEVVGIQRVIEQQRIQLASPHRPEPGHASAPSAACRPSAPMTRRGSSGGSAWWRRSSPASSPARCCAWSARRGRASRRCSWPASSRALADGVLPGSESWPVVVATPGSTLGGRAPRPDR